MKTMHTRKIIAIFTAVSFAFLQAVPAGVAANLVVGQSEEAPAPAPEKPLQNSPEPVKPAAPATEEATDFSVFIQGSNPLSAQGDVQEASAPVAAFIAPQAPAPTVVVTESTPDGKVTVSGTVTPGAVVYYSVKQGDQYLKKDYTLTSATSGGTFNDKVIQLPRTGTYEIILYTKKSGERSEEVSLTRTCTVPVPVFHETDGLLEATPDGKVTLSGTATAGFTVYYTLSNGSKSLTGYASVAADGTWSKEITLLSAGPHTITAYSRKTSDFQSETVSIAATCVVPVPTVVATAPTLDGKVTLSGTVPAGFTVYYSLNGVSYSAGDYTTADGKWSKEITLSKTTPAAISVFAKKSNFQSETVNLVAAPTASLSAGTATIPNPDANGRVKLEGTAPAGYAIFYSLGNGATWKSSGSTAATTGRWTAAGIVLPKAGETTILVAARKTTNAYAIQSGAASVDVNFSVATPTLVATVPTSDGKVNLSGKGPVGYTIYYSVNGGTPVAVGIVPSSGNWSKASVALTKGGDNTITVYAKKGNFQSESAEIKVNLLVSTPTVVATVPTADGKVNLSGKATAGYTIYYSVNGGPAVAAGTVPLSGNWVKTGVLLGKVGENTITVYAKKGTVQSDSAETKVNFTVARPTVVATSPTADGRVTLSGKAPAGYTIYYSMNGGPGVAAGTVPLSGNWIKTGVMLGKAGENTITVYAKKGNFQSENAETKANFVVAMPTVGATVPTADGKVNLSGRGPVGYTIYYSVNGGTPVAVGIVPSSGNWSKVSVALTKGGENAITVYAKKGNFQSDSAEIKVNFPVAKPTVDATVPTADGKVNLSGTAPAGYTVFYSVNGGAPVAVGIVPASGAWTRSDVMLTKAGENSIIVFAKKGTVQSESAETKVNFSVATPTVVATVPSADGKVTLSGLAPAGYTIYYSLDGGDWQPSSAIAADDGKWQLENVQLKHTGVTRIAVCAKKDDFQSEAASVEVALQVAAPAVTRAEGPDYAGTLHLEGTRMDATDLLQYSVDGGVTYKTLVPAGLDTAWHVTITLPNQPTQLLVRTKTKSGVVSEPAIAGNFPGYSYTRQDNVQYLNYLKEIFRDSRYVITAEHSAGSSNPQAYTFKVEDPNNRISDPKYPGKLRSLTIYMTSFDRSPYLSTIRFDNPQPPYTGGPESVPPPLLLGGLAKLLPAEQVDPALIRNDMDMNGLKLLSDFTLVSYEDSTPEGAVIRAIVNGKHYRISYNRDTIPESYNCDPE